MSEIEKIVNLQNWYEKQLNHALKVHLNNKKNEEIKSKIRLYISQIIFLTCRIERFSTFPSYQIRLLEKRLRSGFSIPDSIPVVFKKMLIKRSHYDIYIIDDDYTIHSILGEHFKKKGVSCGGVMNGTYALEELEWNIPKVIIIRVIYPDIIGYELCKKIKSNPKLKNIPVIFLTAIPKSEVDKCLLQFETKADGYISKPFELSDLDIILDLLKK